MRKKIRGFYIHHCGLPCRVYITNCYAIIIEVWFADPVLALGYLDVYVADLMKGSCTLMQIPLFGDPMEPSGQRCTDYLMSLLNLRDITVLLSLAQ